MLCFVGMFVARRYGIDINDLAGLHFFLASDFNVAQLISYMFLHANFQHIFFNMFAVWMFGRVLEQVWGPKRFLTYYYSISNMQRSFRITTVSKLRSASFR